MKKIKLITILIIIFSLTACFKKTSSIEINVPKNSNNIIYYSNDLYYTKDNSISFSSNIEGEIILVDTGTFEIKNSYITGGIDVKFDVKKDHPYLIGILYQNSNDDITINIKYDSDKLITQNLNDKSHLEYQKIDSLIQKEDVDITKLIRFNNHLYALDNNSINLTIDKNKKPNSVVNFVINRDFIPLLDNSTNSKEYLGANLYHDDNDDSYLLVEPNNEIQLFKMIAE